MPIKTKKNKKPRAATERYLTDIKTEIAIAKYESASPFKKSPRKVK